MRLPIKNSFDLTPIQEYLDQLTHLNTLISNNPSNTRVITKKRNSRNYYYERITSKQSKYIRKTNLKVLKNYLQADYKRRISLELPKEINTISKFIKRIQKFKLETIYSELDQEQKKLITPYAVSNEDYAQVWSASPYNSAPRIITEFITSKGEYVKSKSEVIIADTLASMNIPYRYEPIFVTKDGVTKYPDFQLLDTKTRKEYYHEHFGMMDDPDYLRSAINKIDTYAKNGIILGVNFIATFESSEHPLNRNTLKSTLSAVFNHN